MVDAREAGIDYLVLGSIHGLPIGGLGGRQISDMCISVFVRVVDVRTGEIVTTTGGGGGHPQG